MHWRVPLSCAVSRWRKQKSSASLKTQSEMYQAVLDFTHDAILAIDENGRIQVLNPPAERIMAAGPRIPWDSRWRRSCPIPFCRMCWRAARSNWTRSCRSTRPVQHQPDPHPGGRPAPGRSGHLSGREAAAEQRTEDPPQVARKGLVAKYAFNDILGDSPAIRSTIQIARSYAASRASVLILGRPAPARSCSPSPSTTPVTAGTAPLWPSTAPLSATACWRARLFGMRPGPYRRLPGRPGGRV